MKRSKKLKRVSWASGSNLSQVKLFLSDDLPSIVGNKSQDHLQAKTLSKGPSITDEYADLPPGFEDNHFQNQPIKAQIPQIKWKCPSLFPLNINWHVVAGEESKETSDQKFREMRVLEAIYPRSSSIPLSCSVSTDVEKEFYDDNLTSLIPLTPLEEDEESVEEFEPDYYYPIKKLQRQYIPSATLLIKPHRSTINPLCSGKPLGATTASEADIVAAASASAIASIIKSNEQGSLIDMDLLLKLFTDPTVIENLIEERRTATTTVSAPSNILAVASETTPDHMLRPLKKNIPPHLLVRQYSPQQESKRAAVGAKQVKYPNTCSTGVVKDVNYYKELVREHGAHRYSNSRVSKRERNYNNVMIKPPAGKPKPKSQIPCIFFESSRGCRNGSNCPFQHHVLNHWEANKRFKL